MEWPSARRYVRAANSPGSSAEIRSDCRNESAASTGLLVERALLNPVHRFFLDPHQSPTR